MKNVFVSRMECSSLMREDASSVGEHRKASRSALRGGVPSDCAGQEEAALDGVLG